MCKVLLLHVCNDSSTSRSKQQQRWCACTAAHPAVLHGAIRVLALQYADQALFDITSAMPAMEQGSERACCLIKVYPFLTIVFFAVASPQLCVSSGGAAAACTRQLLHGADLLLTATQPTTLVIGMIC